MEDKEIQKESLERIYSSAILAPVFKRNSKFSKGDLIPYICYDDVMNYKYIIRVRPLGEHNSYDNTKREIIAEYDDLESLVNDGWRLD